MEHSYALTHLIPIGLRAIGCHLGSGVNGFSCRVLYALQSFARIFSTMDTVPTIIDRLGGANLHRGRLSDIHGCAPAEDPTLIVGVRVVLMFSLISLGMRLAASRAR